MPITNSDPPNPVKASDAGNLVLRLIDNDIVPEPDDDLTTALYIVLLPQRVGGATLSTPPGLNGAHSYATYSDYDFPVDWDNDSVFYAWISQRRLEGADLDDDLTRDPRGDDRPDGQRVAGHPDEFVELERGDRR